MNISLLISKLYLFSIFAVLVFLFIFTNDSFNYDFLVLFSSFIICIISLYNIFSSKQYPYSLNLITHLFFLFFFGLAPSLQFKQDSFFWNGFTLSKHNYLYGNLMIIIIQFFYILIYNFKVNSSLFKFFVEKLDFNIRVPKFKVVTICIFSILIFFYLKDFNLLSIFFRGGYKESAEQGVKLNSSLTLIINFFIRPIPLVCLIYYKSINQSSKFSFFELFLILASLFSNFPAGMPRFQAAALYIPVLIVYFRVFSKNYAFALFFCLGLLIIFPFLSQFRDLDKLNDNIGIDLTMFSDENFDTYQNTVNVISMNEVTNGSQLLGTLLFFVPRSLWPSKPYSSGEYFANKSLSFFGEGFINFGYVGVFLFTIVLALMHSFIDKCYWWNYTTINVKFSVLFKIFLGMQFFMLRGDLLNAFAYTVGLSLCVVFVSKFIFVYVPK